jgi:beta-glucosidase
MKPLSQVLGNIALGLEGKPLPHFPNDFIWGVATASYQIEGASNLDGRGESIWDRFSKTPGKVANGDNGDVACDHYHRYLEDIQIIKNLGCKAYRFSISWPRLFPDGGVTPEKRGFDFYNRLIDALIAHEIEPVVTLYHWDLPQTLEDKGGWANREIVSSFSHYAKACAETFGDRVKKWITLNEPWCTSWLGYSNGVHAPGKKDFKLAIASSHHTALAHSAGVRAIKSARPDAAVGITLNMNNVVNESPHDQEVSEFVDLNDANLNRWWIDAFTKGKYPEQLLETYGDLLQGIILPGDEDLLKVSTDFLGVNYYCDGFARSPGPDTRPVIEGGFLPFPQRVDTSPPKALLSNLTDMGWVVTPGGIGSLLRRIHSDWPEIQSIVITENGSAFPDVVENEEVNDHQRAQYLQSHIASMQSALSEGVPVKGYFAWSLLDNFEWAEGYAKRFGLVYVDFVTQKRIIKLSGKTFRSILQSKTAILD